MSFEYRFGIQIFPDVLNQVLRGRGGPVDKQMGTLADQVLQQAKENINQKATFRRHHRGREGGGVAASGQVVRIGDVDRQIVFDHPYALGLHEGARPHVMGPRVFQEGPYLRRGPQPVSYSNERVFATMGPINHPGHAPFFYLTRAAAQVGLRSQGQLFRPKLGRPIPVFTP